jgi:hypothetical protein
VEASRHRPDQSRPPVLKTALLRRRCNALLIIHRYKIQFACIKVVMPCREFGGDVKMRNTGT